MEEGITTRVVLGLLATRLTSTLEVDLGSVQAQTIIKDVLEDLTATKSISHKFSKWMFLVITYVYLVKVVKFVLFVLFVLNKSYEYNDLNGHISVSFHNFLISFYLIYLKFDKAQSQIFCPIKHFGIQVLRKETKRRHEIRNKDYLSPASFVLMVVVTFSTIEC